MTITETKTEKVKLHSLKDTPSLIEKLLPAQKISAEAQKERKSGSGQTLTALGSYWKGRKPLILNKACILGALLPATNSPEEDLAVFERLMAIDDESFHRRLKSQRDAEKLPSLNYLDKLAISKRPEECDDNELYDPIWKRVNAHLGTNATSMPELVEQLGIMRFGHKPQVADTFSGSGQISFEAARLGCDVYASDLNPIACMLTWGALNIVGANKVTRKEIEQAQKAIAEAVDQEITALDIEHDRHGNRAKAYLYCLETRCPQTGWLVPMIPSLAVSKRQKVYAKLIPDFASKRFGIQLFENASQEEMKKADNGTIRDGELVYTLDGEEYRTPIKTVRGDYKRADGTNTNRLRRWEKGDFKSRPEDIFQERLYAIQWITKETLGKSRQETFFASVTEEDLERECKVEQIVRDNLAKWQTEGLVPDMPIEPGDETTRLGRERGWTYWHHLFSARNILLISRIKAHIKNLDSQHLQSALFLGVARCLDYNNKMTRWFTGSRTDGGSDFITNMFSNQALNTLINWGCRSSIDGTEPLSRITKNYSLPDIHYLVSVHESKNISNQVDITVTDPPYADAVHYHEITEFFIAWLRKNPPEPFKDWVWDSRRALAVKGSGEDFRRDMVDAYKAMADHMPDNGIQVVMFTHQDAGVWADMASIMWGAGLQVTAAWYIATETTSELKKGGYVQGTVLLVLRKRKGEASSYRDELVQEVKAEVERQIDSLVGLNQTITRNRRNAVKETAIIENLFEDADLQMAGYAAALRILTGYTHIDGQDMTAESLRPRTKGDKGVVGEIIDFAVQVANEHLVPEGIVPAIWEELNGSERFYLKMVELEAVGLKKLDNYQNFAKAFRVSNYTALMASSKANDARLKTGNDFKKAEFDGEFGHSPLRAILFTLYELQKELDSDEVMTHLRDLVSGYHSRRDMLKVLIQYIAIKREKYVPKEAEAARILLARIQNERLGG